MTPSGGRQASVALGHGDVVVAEQMLEDLQAEPRVQHLRGEGMAKPVEPIVSGNPRLLKDHLKALPDGVVGKRPAQPARKEGLGGIGSTLAVDVIDVLRLGVVGFQVIVTDRPGG